MVLATKNIVLDTLKSVKIKNRETSKKGIRVVKMTSNQSVFRQKSSTTREIPSESLKLTDMNSGISVMAREGKI